MTSFLSVVIPVYNEVDNLIPLTEKLLKIIPRLKESWEIIFVDDGSNDGSTKKISALVKENQYIKAVYLTRNFGQTAALAAGIDHAQGKIIITLDADLQNDPEDIPLLLKTLQQTNACSFGD